MRKIFQWILILIGAAMSVNAIVLAVIYSFNMGTVLVLLLSVILILQGIYMEQIKEKTKNGLLKWVKQGVYTLLIIYLGFAVFLGMYGKNDTANYREEAVIVLGAGIRGETVSRTLQHRLDKCIEYANINKNAMIVVSGGKGANEHITEALAMQRYLMEKGISEDRILREEYSTSTQENLNNSKQLLYDYFNRPCTVVIITNDFHVFRASHYANEAGMYFTTLHAKLSLQSLVQNYLREVLAVLKMWLFKL